MYSKQAGDGVCCQYGAGYVQVTNAKTGHEILKRDGQYLEKLEYYMDINAYGKASRVGTSPRSVDEPPDFGHNFNPDVDDPDWPGKLYAAGRGGGANGVTINVRYDLYPEEIMWAWEKLTAVSGSWSAGVDKPLAESGSNGTQTESNNTQAESNSTQTMQLIRTWEKIDSKPDIGKAKELLSYNEDVEPLNLYRFLVSDSSQDGSCCSWGPGFFTITNSSGIVWELTGSDFTTNVEAFIWINEKGESQAVRHAPGLGYVLEESGDGYGTLEIVVFDPM